MESIQLNEKIYKIKKNKVFDLEDKLVFTINNSTFVNQDKQTVYSVSGIFVSDVNNNLMFVIKNDNIYTFSSVSQYKIENGKIVDMLSGIVCENLNVIEKNDENLKQTTYIGSDENTDFNIVNTKIVTENLTVQNTEQTIVNYYENDNDTTNILNQINEYAGKINISDFQNKGRIEDYLSLIQNAQNVINQNKIQNLTVDLAEYENLGSVADELSQLFDQLTFTMRQETTIVDKDFLDRLLKTMKKLYNLSNAFGRFNEVMKTEAVLNIPKSLISVQTTLQNVSNTLSNASSYITYFADSSSITDENIIVNSQLSSSDLNNIHKTIEMMTSTQNNMNKTVDTQITTIKTNINSLTNNITSLSNSLNKLKLKIGIN